MGEGDERRSLGSGLIPGAPPRAAYYRGVRRSAAVNLSAQVIDLTPHDYRYKELGYYQWATKRIDVSMGESVRIICELQEQGECIPTPSSTVKVVNVAT